MVLDEPAPKSKRKYLTLLFAFGVPCFLFLYCCSGLAWPMLDARGRLAGRMSELASIPLPATAIVKHAARMAQRDSSEYYDVEMLDADAEVLFRAVKQKVPADSIKAARDVWTLGPTPKCWQVPALGATVQMELPQGDRPEAMIFLFTPGTGRVLICWAEF